MKNEITTTTPGTFYQLEIITPGDCYGGVYSTKAEAIGEAEQTWNHLTQSEKAEQAFYIHTYGGALKDGETPEDAFLRLVDDNATETACTETEALYSREGDLMEWGDSLSWCEAYETDGEEAFFCRCNGEIVSILYQDGTESINPSGEEIEALARKVNPDFDEYEGREAAEILTDASVPVSGGCRACPWFTVCDGMQATRYPY